MKHIEKIIKELDPTVIQYIEWAKGKPIEEVLQTPPDYDDYPNKNARKVKRKKSVNDSNLTPVKSEKAVKKIMPDFDEEVSKEFEEPDYFEVDYEAFKSGYLPIPTPFVYCENPFKASERLVFFSVLFTLSNGIISKNNLGTVKYPIPKYLNEKPIKVNVLKLKKGFGFIYFNKTMAKEFEGKLTSPLSLRIGETSEFVEMKICDKAEVRGSNVYLWLNKDFIRKYFDFSRGYKVLDLSKIIRLKHIFSFRLYEMFNDVKMTNEIRITTLYKTIYCWKEYSPKTYSHPRPFINPLREIEEKTGKKLFLLFRTNKSGVRWVHIISDDKEKAKENKDKQNGKKRGRKRKLYKCVSMKRKLPDYYVSKISKKVYHINKEDTPLYLYLKKNFDFNPYDFHRYRTVLMVMKRTNKLDNVINKCLTIINFSKRQIHNVKAYFMKVLINDYKAIKEYLIEKSKTWLSKSYGFSEYIKDKIKEGKRFYHSLKLNVSNAGRMLKDIKFLSYAFEKTIFKKDMIARDDDKGDIVIGDYSIDLYDNIVYHFRDF